MGLQSHPPHLDHIPAPLTSFQAWSVYHALGVRLALLLAGDGYGLQPKCGGDYGILVSLIMLVSLILLSFDGVVDELNLTHQNMCENFLDRYFGA